jgi:hypothetical protein
MRWILSVFCHPDISGRVSTELPSQAAGIICKRLFVGTVCCGQLDVLVRLVI